MKTITYNEMLYRAAEAAGRTRDNLPVEEAAVLKSIFASELPDVWASEDWDDLREPILTVTLDDNDEFANPYNTTELGEVLGIYSQDPNGSTPWQRLDFYKQQDQFHVTQGAVDGRVPVPVPDTVYVYYQTACPDLLALTGTALANQEIPTFIGNYLALRGAGHLLAADGAATLAGVQFRLAQEQLGFSRTLIKRPNWAKGF